MPGTVDKVVLTRSVVRECYFEFLKEMWDTIIPEKPVWNWHIEMICEEIQIVMERVFAGKPKLYDLIINIPPGTTKSTASSVAMVPWCWTRMPSLRSINGSHTDSLVLDLSRKSRDIIRSDKYGELFPEIKLREDQDTKGHWENTKGGARISCTVGGKSPTGKHGHVHCIDDPIDPQKALSDLELNTCNVWMSETLSSRKIDKAITPLILIMQRLHQNDSSGYRMNRKGYRLVCLPASNDFEVQPPEVRKFYVNGLLDPIRLSPPVLEEAREELGEYGYAGQYGQSPIPIGGGMFKTDMLTISDTVPVEFKRVVRYWDNAGSPKKTDKRRAWTVGVKMGEDKDGNFWVLDVIRVRMKSDARERLKYAIAKRDGLSCTQIQEQEGGSGGQESAENTVRKLAGFNVKVDKPKGDKVLRADPFSVQVNKGNVYLRAAGWNKDFIEEMKFFPFSTYKDQVDAASGAFANIFRLRKRAGALKRRIA